MVFHLFYWIMKKLEKDKDMDAFLRDIGRLLITRAQVDLADIGSANLNMMKNWLTSAKTLSLNGNQRLKVHQKITSNSIELLQIPSNPKMSSENGGNGDPLACWVESKPCSCGAQHWVAKKVERVAVQLGQQNSNGDLLIPVESAGVPVRRRSINLWRPIAGIFSVNLKEAEVDGAPVSPGLREDDGPHEAIQVLYACKKCSRDFHCTYEMINEEKGKTQSFGKYASSCQCQSKMGFGDAISCEEDHPYEGIQRIYAGMWDKDKFSHHFNNCKHWSDMFWWKL